MYAVEGEVVRPDDARIYSVGIFDRCVLGALRRPSNAVSRSVVVEAVAENHRRVVIRGFATVAGTDVIAVIELVIDFDIELVIGGMRGAAEEIVVYSARLIWLRVKIQNGLADRINFTRRNYVARHAGPARTRWI